jgi:sec-independent protein translocase protein TatC
METTSQERLVRPFSLREGAHRPTVDVRRPFLEHLEELRRRILRSFLWVTLGAVLSFRFTDSILVWLIRPVGKVVFLSPVEPLLTDLKIAFVGGLILSAPLVAWEGWQFLAPALWPGERRHVFFWMPLGIGLFFLGAWLGGTVFLPLSLKVLLSFGSDRSIGPDRVVPMLTLGHYVGFGGGIILATGLMFQMPIAVWLLARLGLVQPRTLLHQWRVAMVVLLAAAAVLTPTPDVVTQLLFAVPLAALYLLSVGFAFLGCRGRGHS